MTTFIFGKILNFYKLCYKIIKLFLFVRYTAVHHGFQQLLQGFADSRARESEGCHIVA